MSNEWNWNASQGGNRGGSHRGGFRRDSHRRMPRNPHFGYRKDGYHKQGGGNNMWDNRPPKREIPQLRLLESDIGVTEFVSDHKGFTGIIKSRYSDFQVSEINDDGKMAELTDMRSPQPPEEEKVDEDEDLLITKYNLEILPMETWDKINTLSVSQVKTNDVVEIDMTGVTKEQRTKIHDAVKKAFGAKIVGSTVNIDDKKFMRFTKYRKGVRVDNRIKWVWPAEYVHFIVHKENCDTLEAAARIAEALKLNGRPSMLGYAGTKDRRAKTSQWFSLRKVDPRKIAAGCSGLGNIHVGNYTFSKTHIKLGMLKGNRFRIVLRSIEEPDEEVDKACENLRSRGFINYYGLQRFGASVDIPTYEIGKQLLQANLKKAVESVVAVAGRGRSYQRHTRMTRALQRRPNDLAGALSALPRNVILLYLHSYQSLIWNKVVSMRIRRFGLKPVAGDLVPLVAGHEDEACEDAVVDYDDDNDTECHEDDTDGVDKQDDVDKDGAENKDGDGGEKSTEAEETKRESKTKFPVKILTQEDIDSSRYTIFDIVMPLPGYNVEYPPNMKDYYQELVAEDNLTLEMKHKSKTYSMSGAYRRMCARPAELSWRRARYSDPRADLLLSDIDHIRGCTTTAELEDGKYKALIITLTLPPSCYATMALRELLKMDTSSATHAQKDQQQKRKADLEIRQAKRAKKAEAKLSEGEGTQAEKGEEVGEQAETAVKEEVAEGQVENDEKVGESEDGVVPKAESQADEAMPEVKHTVYGSKDQEAEIKTEE
ncbi:pseudouridylate synthase 7 homolog [Manduca sexta]|uniref:pseudouridylate synthase 7 homolog n=1 Tax=Manduca sexta TaxID=7130 RepID=UPI0018904508|nr:pseudouridylate synthase 7 homolog [Manduca sexta]